MPYSVWGRISLVSLLLLAACATQPAPVEHRTAPGATAARPKPDRDPDWRPATHIVAKGETLYSLALEYGLDYRELAAWNELADPNLIVVGQVLRLTDPAEKPIAASAKVETKPAAAVVAPSVAVEVVTQPKALKLPYSETALADLNRLLTAAPSAPAKPTETTGKPVAGKPADTAAPKPEVSPGKPAVSKPDAPKPEVAKPESKPESKPEPAAGGDDDLDWGWPTPGKLLAAFKEGQSKGIDIGGKKGQSVISAAAGKVVYSGSGLRGYGKLVIIKHNKTFLSAYAHQQTIFVKEGENVAKGQKIGEMGDTDSDVVKLHFEIRRFGKPVDPSKYLPVEASP